jgi:5-methylcytosine-specific restriction protein A
MAMIPRPTVCSQLGCNKPRIAKSGYCEAHTLAKNKPTQARIDQVKMYNTRQWHKLREIQLSKQPLCQACLCRGVVKQALHVDHLFPWSTLGKLYFYHNVFQSLCKECHSVKTGLENHGIYRHYAQPEKDYKIEDAKAMIGGGQADVVRF